MRCRSVWYDPSRIDLHNANRISIKDIRLQSLATYLGMTLEVMMLDAIEISRILECTCIRSLVVQIVKPSFDIWIVFSDCSDVAFEMCHIDWIKSNNGGKETYICFCQFTSNDKFTTIAEHFFNSIEALQEEFRGDILVQHQRHCT